MIEQANIEALYRRLLDDRRKVVETAAESGALPPAKFLAYLAHLDGAIVAVEVRQRPCSRTGLACKPLHLWSSSRGWMRRSPKAHMNA